jgi:diaminopimelate epimerase
MSDEHSSQHNWDGLLPRGRPFLKMHGLRNHFIMVDARDDAWRPAREESIWLCDPQVGVGADQVVVLEQPSHGGGEQGAVAFVRFWNVDGREAEACGNATRCAAWLLLEERGEDDVLLETRAGVLECRRVGTQRVSTGMGRIRTSWRDIPLSEERETGHLDIEHGPLRDPIALNIGNPHLVFFVDDVDEVDLEGLAPSLQADPLFPEGINVGIAQVLSETEMRLRVFERGAGLTMACGSGACVAVFAALARGLTESRTMTVRLPGGALDIEILADGSAVMTGPVAYCFSGNLPRER